MFMIVQGLLLEHKPNDAAAIIQGLNEVFMMLWIVCLCNVFTWWSETNNYIHINKWKGYR